MHRCVDSSESDEDGDDNYNEQNGGYANAPFVNNTFFIRKINNKETISMNLSGPGATDDVDELVERINHLNSPGRQVNPKKAAKKARQKLRKQQEKEQKSAEIERELRERQERQRALEPRIDEAVAGLQYLALNNKGRLKGDKENEKLKRRDQHSSFLATQSSSKKDASRRKNGNDYKANVLKEPVKVTIEFLNPDEPSEGSNAKRRNRRSFVIKDFPEGIQDPSQLVDILQRRRKTFPLNDNKKSTSNGNYSEAIEVEISDSESDFEETPPPPPPAPAKISNQQNSNSSSGNKKSKKKNKGGNSKNESTSVAPQQQQSHSVNSSCNKKSTKNNGSKTKTDKTATKISASVTTQRKDSIDLQSKLQQDLRAENNHISWNRLTQGESSSESSKSKPEMVTIRRHPTISDTTVTISIKNPNGEEDILYTLLNGQVVRTKPESLIAEEDSSKNTNITTKKASKKKRKKKNKKEPLQPPLQIVENDIDNIQHSKDEVEIESASGGCRHQQPHNKFGQQQQSSTNGPSIYYSDGFHSKPNVIVVDSQEYNVDNESDADDYVGFKKRPNKFEEVVSVKMKRLRNRVNKYLYGDDPSTRQDGIPEKIITPQQANIYLNQHINRGAGNEQDTVNAGDSNRAVQDCSKTSIIGGGLNRSSNSTSVKWNPYTPNNNNCQIKQKDTQAFPSVGNIMDNTNQLCHQHLQQQQQSIQSHMQPTTFSSYSKDSTPQEHYQQHFNMNMNPNFISQCPQQTTTTTCSGAGVSDFGSYQYYHNVPTQPQTHSQSPMDGIHSSHSCHFMTADPYYRDPVEFQNKMPQQQQFMGNCSSNSGHSSIENSSYPGAQNFSSNSRLRHVHTPLFSVNPVDATL